MKTPRVLLFIGVVMIGWAAGLLLRRADPMAGGATKPSAVRFLREPVAIPEFTASDIDGRAVASTGFRGKVTILNFWATWCPPCRAEIPALIALQEKYPDQLQIVGIAEDDAGAAVVKQFAIEHRMNYTIVMATAEVERLFPAVEALPTSFLIDREGRVVKTHVGMLSPSLTELEVRALAGLPVDVPVEFSEGTVASR